MKKLPISSAGFALLIAGFAEWLDILGYSAGTIQSMPSIVREFLHYLEASGCNRIDQLKSEHVRGYHGMITGRTNERRGGGLSNNYITKHIQTLEKFMQYLHHRGAQNLPSIAIKPPKVERPPIVVLSKEDVAELFKACDPQDGEEKAEALRARDRAMLAVFYGCGLRRNEAANVRVDDIDLDARTIKVRKGKNYKERLVPIGKTGAKQLAEWIYDHRPFLLSSLGGDGHGPEEVLFVATGGKAMSGGMLYHRLKVIQQNTESAELRSKTIGLHTLRHAIATHLLQAGMELQKIARFLGHSSMDSTQIYTHLSAEAEGEGGPIREAHGNVR